MCSIDVCDVCYYELWYFLDVGLLPQHSFFHQMVVVEPILDSDPLPPLSEWSIDQTMDGLRVLRRNSRTEVVASGKSSEVDDCSALGTIVLLPHTRRRVALQILLR